MKPHESSDCIETLLDLLCYEVRSGRLSPEVEYLLQDHLASCPSCRRHVAQLAVVIYGTLAYQNSG